MFCDGEHDEKHINKIPTYFITSKRTRCSLTDIRTLRPRSRPSSALRRQIVSAEPNAEETSAKSKKVYSSSHLSASQRMVVAAPEVNRNGYPRNLFVGMSEELLYLYRYLVLWPE